MIPTRDQEIAVLQSVIYASLFDYPLTLDQLHHALLGISATKAGIRSWWQSSDLLQSAVEHCDGLYFPAGRRDLIATRARREALSRDLLQRDQRILRLVSAMPFVRMVALSGSLAHLNAEGSADLDLFVITAPNRVWSVTLAVLALSRLSGWRRHLCMNYVVSTATMKITPKDLFSANQIIHLQPTYGHDVFARFVSANAFVKRFYPNFAAPAPAAARTPVPKRLLEIVLTLGPAPIAEALSRVLYRWHLRRRAATWQSSDQVRLAPQCLKLHTSSHRASILARFEQAMVDALKRIEDDTPREVMASRS